MDGEPNQTCSIWESETTLNEDAANKLYTYHTRTTALEVLVFTFPSRCNLGLTAPRRVVARPRWPAPRPSGPVISRSWARATPLHHHESYSANRPPTTRTLPSRQRSPHLHSRIRTLSTQQCSPWVMARGCTSRACAYRVNVLSFCSHVYPFSLNRSLPSNPSLLLPCAHLRLP